ncbi:MAG: sugar phosphate isomerase/epimerase family protein [Acidiphilium sp.]
MRDLSNLCFASINTATLGYQRPISSTIEMIAELGFGAISPWRRELEGEDVTAVARQIRDAGLAVSGYCRSTYLPAPTRAAFRASLDDNRKAIDQAATLDAACFVMVVGSLPEGSRSLPDARAQLAEGLADLSVYARAVGVRLALEPLHPMYAADRSCLNTIVQALDLCVLIEPGPCTEPTLGLAIDAYHVWWDPALFAGIARAGRERRIFAYHVCDWRRETRDLLNDRAMMGDGVIDLKPIRQAVETAGYMGAVEVEIFSSFDWWKRPIEETLAICAERLATAC